MMCGCMQTDTLAIQIVVEDSHCLLDSLELLLDIYYYILRH